MSLNEKQLEAISHTNGPLLILAGAGSGKTRVIVHKITNLITKQNIHPAEILAVTFTNKAAGEMRSRIEQMLQIQLKNLCVSTFHSFCLKVLRTHHSLIELAPHFQIVNESGQIALLKDCLAELNISDKLISPNVALHHISRAKDKCSSPSEFKTSATGFITQKVADIYILYQAKLLQNQAVDFGDLIRLCVQMFESNPQVLNYYQNRFKYVLVDEYQDTNHAQYRLIELLVRTHKNICVVGDEDQSIYRWRGADISNILSFEKDFPGAKIIRLEQNYRSTKTIINAAQKVIENNFGRKEKCLWTNSEEGSPIKIISTASDLTEAEAVTKEIIALGKDGNVFGSTSVFYRTNAQSRSFEEFFLKNNIPYKIFGGVRFYERREVKDLIAYLRLLTQPQDDISFERIINTPPRGIGKETIQKLKTFARLSNRSMYDSISDFCASSNIRKNIVAKLLNIRGVFEKLKNSIHERPLPDVMKDILNEIDYFTYLSGSNDLLAEDRKENINELLKAIEEFNPTSEQPVIVEFLDQVALISEIDNLKQNNNVVTLMTLHLAKGLEFDNVFIVGMEEGLFPHSRSMDDPEELEEERRLCYVGMTRARKKLTLTHAFKRNIYGNSQYSVTSRFIDEIPANYTEKIFYQPPEALFTNTVKTNIRRQPLQKKNTLYTSFNNSDSDFDQRPEDEQSTPYAMGTFVHHPTLGQGKVTNCEASSMGHKVTVLFKNGIMKKLIAEKAGLVPTSE
ncbi:MAG: ATP-dependent DNA helicase PcrA [Deltaproteobacteria bacterium CG07_land_8_20_14_0_80_38_7]|nr:MAG: ATP-dependent DNA helicase PcrA [Deltaproteobacteria bacterium CG07_land_8_20_14_0_80_38_7]